MDIPGMGFLHDPNPKGVKRTISDKIDKSARAVLAGIGVKRSARFAEGSRQQKT
jgi:hypothetical protein